MALDVYLLPLMYAYIFKYITVSSKFVKLTSICNVYVFLKKDVVVFLLYETQDRQVSELAQDLANKLGLKIRKAYVSPQVCSLFPV